MAKVFVVSVKQETVGKFSKHIVRFFPWSPSYRGLSFRKPVLGMCTGFNAGPYPDTTIILRGKILIYIYP
jgi:hypothetical protein